MADTELAALQAAVLTAAAERRVLRPQGGASKDFYGNALTGEVLATKDYRGITAYEPAELFITARCGTTLAEIETTLAAENQMLACEPPQFSPQSTLGGAVAAGLSGPRRVSAGALRDHLLGVRLLDGNGQVLKFGGQVMKNVAGFDVARLLAGSLGTLGVIVEASLKVLPLPTADLTLRFAFAQQEAMTQVNRWVGAAWPLVASAWEGGILSLRLAGAEAAVGKARAALGGNEIATDAARLFWRDVRDQRLPWFSGDVPLWRFVVPPTAPPLPLTAPTLIEWHGGQRWLRAQLNRQEASELAAQSGGHATLFRPASPEERRAGVFQPLSATLLTLNQKLCAAFDPQGVFANGRLSATAV